MTTRYRTQTLAETWIFKKSIRFWGKSRQTLRHCSLDDTEFLIIFVDEIMVFWKYREMSLFLGDTCQSIKE